MIARPSPVAAAGGLFCGLLTLGGCAPSDGFPSLAMRPVELQRSFEEPERPPVIVPSDASLLARIQALRGEAGSGDSAFEAAWPAAQAAVGRAGGRESESWIEAQQALSRLEAARA